MNLTLQSAFLAEMSTLLILQVTVSAVTDSFFLPPTLVLPSNRRAITFVS